ncbi:ArnT family glycosyltransferase [Anaerolinea thermophila]|uniref:Hypothetical membrane protein n=1 Tax=Anaerolinea thermophila (strain DSM 14523 / JCM 11388 / NBRC 100420 / UNI-1) TaxID=926569 RepID=E8N085_ANATU|nr:glycosyltransferase family 39 protein [Anaerolinea thermophila]BAJ64634.1 hypothetical membrane protein [Anaerolinea thermophila UNI-1]
MKDSLKKISFALVVFVLPIFTLLPYSPWVMKGLHRDSGVFLYVGQQILNGGLPYRDIWDHKPPVIYYVNALGLLFDNSRWGVWTIELVCLVISSLLAYQLIKKHFGDFVGLIVSTLWLLTLVFVLQGGNLTEEYALVFQFLLLVMFDRINGKNRSILYFSVGVFSGLMFCIKQTTIGIFLGIIVLTLYKMFGKRQLFLFKNIFLIILGWTLFPAFWVLYFYIHGGLPNLLEAFYYNFVYSSQNKDLLNRLAPLITGIEPLTETGFFQFGMIGYILLVMDIFLGKDNNKWLVNLLQLIAVTLPIEYVLVSLSGHTYKHYYITLLPMLSLSSAYFIKVIINYCSLVALLQSWLKCGKHTV